MVELHPAHPRLSIVIPAYMEGDAITPCLQRILEAVQLPHEILVGLTVLTTRRSVSSKRNSLTPAR